MNVIYDIEITMVLKKKLFLYFILTFSPVFLLAQESAKHREIDKEFRDGIHLFDMQQYNAAYKSFEKVNSDIIRITNLGLSEDTRQMQVQSIYYMAICDLELYHEGAENKLVNFVERYPENPLSKTASYELGSFFYRQKNFSKAIEWFEKTELGLLGKSSQNEFHFRYGYSLFENEQFEKASEHFEALIDKNSKYSYPAAYYDGIIQFNSKKYGLALDRFNFIKSSKSYAEVVPFYLAKIHFEQNKYLEALQIVNDSYKISPLKFSNELYLIGAASAFSLNDWDKTIEYYELASKKNPLSDLAKYELGFAYFEKKAYQNAIDQLKNITDKKTSFTQHALYVIGQCFYALNDKPSSRNAFGKASKLNDQQFLTSSALLNYAKLSYELNFYQTAIESFQDYIDAYPDSTDADDAQALLGDALLYTKNYKLAIEILEKIQPRSKRANIAYQKVSYFRGIELYNEGKYQEAIKLFNQSLSNPLDLSIRNFTWYWKAETNYQLGNFDDALKYFSLYEQNDIKYNKELSSAVNYQLGYTYFKKEDYKSAIVYFDRYLKSEIKLGSELNIKRYNDAVLRLADGYFMIKEYDKALFSYNKIINEKASSSDYSMFQKSMILGLQNKQNDKIVTLKALLNNYPSSTYADDAIYEIGNSYFIMNNTPDAIQNFLSLIQKYPNSRFVAKSRLSLGLIYYNESNDEKATEMYKAIISDYPGSEEAKEALLAIKNIYVDAGNAEGYLNYVKTLPFASVSSGAQDSITYQAANNRFLVGDCENAINGFNNYIERFANGSFILEAHASRAECFIKTKRDKMALIDYEYLVNNSNPKYIERSLIQSARINYKLKEYKKAAKLYVQLESQAEFKDNYLEAIAGAMKSYAALNDSIGILKYAQQMLLVDKASIEDQYMANLYLARYYFGNNNIIEAEKYYNTVAKLTKTEYGAEAKYMLAKILFIQEKYSESQQACFDLSNQVPSYEYWVAKGFIILADTYAKLGNDFQAKSTLESIIDEYSIDNDGIVEEARKKLNELTQPK